MITDAETNLLYLADCLPVKQPSFFRRFEKLLSDCSIAYKFLPNTKDIWAVDYMPVQVEENQFVQFVYNPDYLQSKRGHKTISDVDSICESIGVTVQKTNIVMDGGNVTPCTDKVIMCDKVFRENANVTEKRLIKKLEELFQVDKLYFVPQDRYDCTGHADGMVRFVDDNTVLINDYSKESSSFQMSFRMSLHNAGLDWIEVPYNPYNNKTNMQANGGYINFLQMKDVVIMPVFGMKEDEEAEKLFQRLFKGQTVTTINCNEIANEGGVLNCIRWNIKI